MCFAWIRTFKNFLYFRKLFCLIFFTVMMFFRTLLNRNMWLNPLSDVMAAGGFGTSKSTNLFYEYLLVNYSQRHGFSWLFIKDRGYQENLFEN